MNLNFDGLNKKETKQYLLMHNKPHKFWKKYKKIKEQAFIQDKNIKFLDFPCSVKDIEKQAFKQCNNLEYINYTCRNNFDNENVKFGIESFACCSNLKSVNINTNAQTLIGDNAFYNCTSLEEVLLGKNVNKIKVGAFASCTNLKTVEIKCDDCAISPNAFENCINIQELKMSKKAKVSRLAFKGCDFDYIYNDGDKIIISRTKPQNLNPDNIFVDLNYMEQKIIGFNQTEINYNLLIQVQKCYNFAKKLDKLNVALPDKFIKYIVDLNLEDDFINNSNFAFFKSEVQKEIQNNNITNIEKLYKTAKILGCFDNRKLLDKNGDQTQTTLAQKSSMFLGDVLKRFPEYIPTLCECYDFFAYDKDFYNFKVDPNFIQFLTEKDGNKRYSNLDLIANLENKCPGLFSKLIINFEHAKKFRKTLKDGQPKNVSWKQALVNFYNQYIYDGVTEETEYAAKLFSEANIQPCHFNMYLNINEEMKKNNIQNNITKAELKEQLIIQEIEQIKKDTKLTAEDCELKIKEAVKKQFTYEFLDKYDPNNAIIGLLCDCCATIHNSTYGADIAKHSMTSNDVQNIVIKESDGTIIAKSSLYVNREFGYGVLNDFEMNKKYRKGEYMNTGTYLSGKTNDTQREKIFDAFLRAIQDFVKQYDKENPNMPIAQINVGMGYNRLKKQCQQLEKEDEFSLLYVPEEYRFNDAAFEQYVVYRNNNINRKLDTNYDHKISSLDCIDEFCR